MKIPINIKEGTIDKEEKKKTIVGIDLGTTNSIVAYMEDGRAKPISDQNKHVLVPSVIYFEEGGNTVVGDEAQANMIHHPERSIYSSKRLMGRSYEDLSKTKVNLAYKISESEDPYSLVKVLVDGRSYSPIELSAFILKEMKSRAETALGQTIDSAVITVPAYFNDAQRQATRDAGKLAGLDVLRIINEPTAASLAYGIGLNQEESHTIAVYDLGGGTFDISILQIEDGVFEVLSTNGDTALGGDDFDQLLVEYLVHKYHLEVDAMKALRLVAKKIKQDLSHQDICSANYENIAITIDRSEFENLIQPLVAKTIESCKAAMADAKLSVTQIDTVVMVGGSTRVPLVKQSVSGFFKKEVFDSIDPDTVVALGAAIQADILAGNRKDLLLLDVTPLSLGIETVGGLMDTIIPRNSKVPARAARQYTTSIDGQKNLKVSIYQGERDLVAHNRKLGEFILKDIPPMAAGLPKIEIAFILDADGILTVKASELRSSTSTSVEIRSAYRISEEDMAMMLIDSIQNAEADMAQRSLLENINEANNVIQASKKFIVQNGEILSDEEIQHLNEYVKKLVETISLKDKDLIVAAMDELNTYSRPLAERALDYNISKALKGKEI